MSYIRSEKLSVYEWYGLSSKFDLSTAYPVQEITPKQKEMLQELPAIFAAAHGGDALASKRRFDQAFFALAGQPSVHKLSPPLGQYSGSIAIEVMANYLRLRRKSVTLLQPTFDALADTLKRHDVHPLLPIDEAEAFHLNEASPRIKTDALYLVCPNNPTGHCPTKDQFTNIVAYCKKYKILLIIDFCFRFYGDFWDYDQYQIMQDAGIDFITTEDTGKTWPTAEIKLGMLLTSKSLSGAFDTISDDFLVGVSPFVYELMTRYIGLEHPEQRRLSSQDAVDRNRAILRQALADTPIKLTNEAAHTSIEWLLLPGEWHAVDLAAWLHKHGMQILPGERFYWYRHELGRRYIRIALLRPEAAFKEAITLLGSLAKEYDPARQS